MGISTLYLEHALYIKLHIPAQTLSKTLSTLNNTERPDIIIKAGGSQDNYFFSIVINYGVYLRPIL